MGKDTDAMVLKIEREASLKKSTKSEYAWTKKRDLKYPGPKKEQICANAEAKGQAAFDPLFPNDPEEKYYLVPSAFTVSSTHTTKDSMALQVKDKLAKEEAEARLFKGME